MRYLIPLLLFLLLSVQSKAQSFKMEGNEIVLAESIQFKNGTAELSSETQPGLIAIKDFLIEKSYISQLRVESHIGSKNANSQSLSEKRALTISKWLIGQGIDCKRLVAVGFGPTKPVSASETEKNTRIVFAIASLKDKLVGGMPADGGGQIAGDLCKIPK